MYLKTKKKKRTLGNQMTIIKAHKRGVGKNG